MASPSPPTRRAVSSSRTSYPPSTARPRWSNSSAFSAVRGVVGPGGGPGPRLPILHTEVETPFEQKGLVMRTLMEQLAEEDAELILLDGIKVLSATGWVLVVPDPEEPTTHVWAEGADRADSERLSRRVRRALAPDLSGAG